MKYRKIEDESLIKLITQAEEMKKFVSLWVPYFEGEYYDLLILQELYRMHVPFYARQNYKVVTEFKEASILVFASELKDFCEATIHIALPWLDLPARREKLADLYRLQWGSEMPERYNADTSKDAATIGPWIA